MLSTICVSLALGLVPQDPAQAPARQPLSVLFAGEAGTERDAAFLKFLRERFDKVESIPAAELLASKGKDFDVVIADGTTSMKDNRLEMKGCTKLEFPADWTKPTILIATAGKAVEKTTKIGWL